MNIRIGTGYYKFIDRTIDYNIQALKEGRIKEGKPTIKKNEKLVYDKKTYRYFIIRND